MKNWFHYSRQKFFIAGVIILWLGLSGPAWGTSPASPAPNQAPQQQWVVLERLLTETAQDFEKKNAALQGRLVKEKETLAAIKQETEELGTAVSIFKAAIMVSKISLPKAVDLFTEYSLRRDKVTARLNKLTPEINNLQKSQAESQNTQANLEAQVQRLKELGPPSAAYNLFLSRYERYQKLTAAEKEGSAQLLLLWQTELQQLQKQQELLRDLTSSLETYVEKRAKQQLFERQETSALRVSPGKLLVELSEIPSRSLAKIKGSVQPGALAEFLRTQLTTIIGLLIFFGLLVYGVCHLRKGLWGWMGQVSESAVNFSQKFFLALLKIIVRNSFLLMFTGWMAVSLWTLDLFKNLLTKIIFSGLVYVTVFRLGSDLIWALFSPPDPNRGIIVLDRRTAQFYARYLRLFLAYLFAVQWTVDSMDLLQYHADTLIFLAFICLVGVLLWFAWLLKKQPLENLLPGLGLAPHSWGSRIVKGFRRLVMPLLVVIIVSDLLGFHLLSLYLSSGAVNTALVVVIFWFLAHLGSDLGSYLTHPTDGFLARKFEVEAARLESPHTFLPKVIRAAILIVVVLGVLLFWGVPLSSYKKLLRLLFEGPDLGPIKLTPMALILAVGSIYLCRLLSHLIRFILEKRVFTRTVWNVAVQQTISTAANYGLMALGIILALSFLGVNLRNLALIVGGLGIGVGFGLQNIVSNFVSGLILLFERPIKVGDALIVDGQLGEVKAIRVRSTVFETRDHCILIIPNSELLSSKIQNWTHFGKGPFRLTLKVGVAYGSDVDAVSEIINQVCRDNARVLPDPPPEIIFNKFGESSLEITIRVHLKNIIDDLDPATDELNRAIYRALGAAGIEIPFPQVDLHFKTPSTQDIPSSTEIRGPKKE